VQVNGATDAAAVGISKAGGLIGEKTSTGSVAIKNVTFAGSVTTTAENGISGGVIGNWEENSKLAVSNVTVTETGAVTLSAKNSAGVVVGRMVGSNAEHEIANIVSMGTLSLTTKNMDGYQGAGGVIGYYQASDTAETLTVTNVALDNLTVESNTGKSLAGQDLVSMNRESIGVGGVIGNYRAWINSALIIQNVLIGGGTLSMTGIGSDGSTIYHKDGSVGGILGYVSEYAGMYKVDHDGDSTTATEYVLDRYTGTITIANCETNLALNSAIKTSNQGVGGLVGSYGQRGQNDDAIPDSHASSVLNISDCVVGGSVSGANNSVAGVIGFVGFCGSTVNINRVIVDASAITTTDDAQVGLILGRALRTGIALTVANCSTTLTEAISMAGDLGAQKGHEPTDDGYALTGCTIMVNGIAYTAGTDGWNGGAFDLQSDVIAIVSDAEIAKMVTYGTDGYIDSVRGHVVGGYEQHTTPGEDGTYDIRFIALVNQNDENVKEYGISLRMTDSNGEVTYFAVTCEAYEVLEGFDREGLPAYEYDAMDDYGAKKFIAAVATNVPMEALTFDVIAWYTTNSGVTVYDTIKTAEYSNAGVLVNAM